MLECLCFRDRVTAWIKEALLQSHVDEKKEHDAAITRLQADYNSSTTSKRETSPANCGATCESFAAPFFNDPEGQTERDGKGGSFGLALFIAWLHLPEIRAESSKVSTVRVAVNRLGAAPAPKPTPGPFTDQLAHCPSIGNQ